MGRKRSEKSGPYGKGLVKGLRRVPVPDGWLLAILLVPAGCGMMEINPAPDGWMWANRLIFVGKIMQDMLEVIA